MQAEAQRLSPLPRIHILNMMEWKPRARSVRRDDAVIKATASPVELGFELQFGHFLLHEVSKFLIFLSYYYL